MNEELLETVNNMINASLMDSNNISLGRIKKVNKSTVDLQITIPKRDDGKVVQMPLMKNVPSIHFFGGDSYETFPISVDDPCIVFFVDRCTDAFLSDLDNEMPPDDRLNDFSDAIALVGLTTYSTEHEIKSIISRHGDAEHTGSLARHGDDTHTGNIERTGTRSQTGDDSITGNVVVDGNVTISNAMACLTLSVNGVQASGTDGKISAPLSATNGASGTFSTESNTITVVDGIITEIS